MPFFDHRGPDAGDYEATPKQDVTLRQLGSTADKTSFTCEDAFGWADSPSGVPPLESRVAGGTDTDLASIPPFLWGLISSYGRHTMPAILHDVRCEAAKGGAGLGGSPYAAYLRRRADQQFRHTLRVHAAKGIVTRYVMWSAVRLFGFLPIGVAVVLGVIVSMLHVSSDVFVAVSAILSQVTIWPWLSWLDFIPKGIAWMLARSSEALQPDLPFTIIVGVLLTAAVVLIAYRSVEKRSVNGSASFSIQALGSLVFASLVAVLSAPPLLPLILVTVVTRLVLWLLDFVLHWVEVLVTKILQAAAGAAPANVNIPETVLQGTAKPPFPGLFPSP